MTKSYDYESKYLKTELLFKNTKNGNVKAFTSKITIAELYRAFRRLMYNGFKKELNDKNIDFDSIDINSFIEKVDNAANKLFDDTMDMIENLGDEKFKIFDSEMKFNDVLLKCIELTKSTIGNMITINNYKQIETLDFFHIVMILESPANMFVTSDRGFNALKNSELLHSIDIETY